MNLMQLFVSRARSAIYSWHWSGKRRSDRGHSGRHRLRERQVDESEPDKGTQVGRLLSQRCVLIPNDPAQPKFAQDCVGKYEYMPDKSWKATGTCTDTFKGGDKRYETWEEGSHLKEYTYKIYRWHWQIRRRQWRWHVHVRGSDRHTSRRHIQGPVGTALSAR